MNTIITVSNKNKTIVKEASNKQEAEKMVLQLTNVFGELFEIGLAFGEQDVWSLNYDK